MVAVVELQDTQDGTLDLGDWNPHFYLDGDSLAVSELNAELDGRGRLVFFFEIETTNPLDNLLDRAFELEFPNGERARFLPTSSIFSHDTSRIKIEGVPTKSPLTISFGGAIDDALGKMFNVDPSTFLKPVHLETPRSIVTLTTVSGASQAYKAGQRRSEALVETGNFHINPKNECYGITELEQDRSLLWSFFRFVSGTHVGFGSWMARDKTSKLVALQPEVGSCDPLQSGQNWASFFCFSEIVEIFELYQSACTDEDKRQTLNRAFGLYRTSTVARSFAGVETGIILAQSALELLCDYTLETFAGWSSELKGQVKGFHNKLSASSAFIGFDGSALEHAQDVRDAFKRQNANTINDFHILTLARNQFTHAKQKVNLNGIEQIRIWEASMFLVEMHIFYLLKFRGEMNDRRKMAGWFGDTIRVPLTTSN